MLRLACLWLVLHSLHCWPYPGTPYPQVWVGEDSWCAQLHLHIVQNIWQPLHGLSHSVIMFQKVLSRISTVMFVAWHWLLFWLASGQKNCPAIGQTLYWFVTEFLENWLWASIWCLQNFVSGDTHTGCCGNWGFPRRMGFKYCSSLNSLIWLIKYV